MSESNCAPITQAFQTWYKQKRLSTLEIVTFWKLWGKQQNKSEGTAMGFLNWMKAAPRTIRDIVNYWKESRGKKV